MSVEVFEHTADVGLRVRAPAIESLFEEAAAGLVSLILTNPAEVQAVQQKTIQLTGDQLDLLLFDWLNELLYVFETEAFLPSRCTVRIVDSNLRATVAGETVDVARHRLEHEVKAITYHGLRVEQVDGEWLAEVILDI